MRSVYLWKASVFPENLWEKSCPSGYPQGLQGAVFCLANIFIQSAVNSFGSIAVAGSAISMNYEYFSYYILSACGQAATTFVSQNYAAGNRQRCRRILVLCLVGSVLFDSIVNTPLVIWPAGIFGDLFLRGGRDRGCLPADAHCAGTGAGVRPV